MDRRDFMKAVCATGAGGAIFLTGTQAFGAEAKPEASLEACERDSKSCRAWILDAVRHVEAKLGEKETTAILESCGRSCARRGSVKAAEKCRGDLDAFLTTMRGWIGEKNVIREGSTVELIYSQCYCPNVRSVEVVPPVYCNCSRGWVMEMFETVLGKSVEVDLLSSIKRGDKECRLIANI